MHIGILARRLCWGGRDCSLRLAVCRGQTARVRRKDDDVRSVNSASASTRLCVSWRRLGERAVYGGYGTLAQHVAQLSDKIASEALVTICHHR
jgi:hypothetical protein